MHFLEVNGKCIPIHGWINWNEFSSWNLKFARRKCRRWKEQKDIAENGDWWKAEINLTVFIICHLWWNALAKHLSQLGDTSEMDATKENIFFFFFFLRHEKEDKFATLFQLAWKQMETSTREIFLVSTRFRYSIFSPLRCFSPSSWPKMQAIDMKRCSKALCRFVFLFVFVATMKFNEWKLRDKNGQRKSNSASFSVVVFGDGNVHCKCFWKN